VLFATVTALSEGGRVNPSPLWRGWCYVFLVTDSIPVVEGERFAKLPGLTRRFTLFSFSFSHGIHTHTKEQSAERETLPAPKR